MKKFAITISAVVALTGCATGPTPLDRLQSAAYQQVVLYASESQMFLDSGKSQDELKASAQEAIARNLKDPAAAQFRNVRVMQFTNGRVVCGEVNGKNSYGAYVGFKRFAASNNSGTIESTGNRYPHIDVAANSGIDAACF
ncbi:putative periplasmic lipoprotein [Comamonas squillarum]|uniref:Lipoprotein n=1 Tax=Comamonas squillarum TaxID=2977320 RepID=A0ABY5ZX13_9BURK|nr:hypothetical protein [Comamonas sp. PR12]UXC18532.1 hypothetical protein N4T19_23100 [Comamonas sp. PR12]